MSGAESRERRRVLSSLGLLGGVLLIAWLGSSLGWFGTAGQPSVLVLYGFSTLRDVMEERLLPAFQSQWAEEQGRRVEVVATFAGSGEITDRILARYPAEIAIVSSELDAHRLPTPWRSWRQLPYQGVLARSPLVLVTRPGNPKGLQSYEDLGRAGVELLHGDPASSGAAELAILAQYGSMLRSGEEAGRAVEKLGAIWRNVSVQLPTAIAVRQRFEAGKGDAFVTYEEDVVGSPSRARIDGEIVYPAHTIVAEPLVVKINKNIDSRQEPLIDAFVAFLWSAEAQRVMVEYGLRSVDPKLGGSRPDQPPLGDTLTVADLGGPTARRRILEEIWRDRVLAKLGE